jgi:hypothetical protein
VAVQENPTYSRLSVTHVGHYMKKFRLQLSSLVISAFVGALMAQAQSTTPTPSPTPSTPTPTPLPTPTAPPNVFGRLSTRAFIGTDVFVLSSSFVSTGTAPKRVLLRALGPSLNVSGSTLADPTLELRDGTGNLIGSNDNWRDSQEAEIIATGQAPSNNLESAIVIIVSPGRYTATVKDRNNFSGVGKIDIIDLDTSANSKLASISSRAYAQLGSYVILGEFRIDGPQSQQVIIRGLGPSLNTGGSLPDPTLELRNSDGTLLVTNDNWQDDPAQAAIIIAAGLAPSNYLEAAIAATLPPGAYSVVLVGSHNGTGVAQLEVYDSLPTTLGNISTRLRVETGNNVLIGGFIITGTPPKKVIVRAIGPSLSSFFPGALADPVLELRDSSGGLIRSNDNWRSDQEAEIIATGIPPTNNLESAIAATLPANSSAYTAIVRGVNNGTGIGVVEAYDLDRAVDSKLANISTRGFVQTGDNVLIGGLIVLGQNPLRVIVRAIGPSLPGPGALGNPTLELHDGNGGLIASNNDWRSDQEAEIIATGIPPSNDLESAIVRNLAPGNYTAIVRGVNNTTGVALVEAYGLN